MLRYRYTLTAAVLLALSSLTPTTTLAANEPTERTVIDATFVVDPVKRTPPCLRLDAGQLTITTRVVAPAIEKRPATFWLTAGMADPNTEISIVIRDTEITQSQHIAGGRYCWGVEVTAPEAVGLSSAERGAYQQDIAVKVTLKPDA